jgi:hypothetical protein
VFLAIPLIVLVAILFALGASATSATAGGATSSWLGTIIKKAAFFAPDFIKFSIAFAKWLANKMGIHYGALVQHAVKWFTQLAHYQDVVGYWSLYWPIGLYHEVVTLTTVTIPRLIDARTKPLNRRIDTAEAEAKAAAGIAHSFPKVAKGNSKVRDVTVIERVAMPHAGEWDWIHHHWTALQRAVAGVASDVGHITLPHAPAWPRPWRGIRSELGKLWKFRNYVLSATGAAALVAIGIGGVSGNCVKKGAIGKVARRLCGLSSHALNDLLGLLVDAFIITDVCAVVDVIGEAAKLVQQPLVEVVGGLEAALCHGDYSAPATLHPPQLYLPDTLSTQLYVA